MTVVGFFSVKGAPGTTSVAMLAAALWPAAALLADCDPIGGDMGLRLPRPDGQPLDQGVGLLSLLPLARRTFEPEALLEHTQQISGGGEIIVGLGGPEQAHAVSGLWTNISAAFGRLDRDVVVDLGRLDPRSPVLPLALGSELLVCVTEATVSSTVAARARLRTLRSALLADGAGPKVGLVVRSGDPRESENAASVIIAEFPEIVFLGHIAYDRAGAGMFDGRPVSRPERTLFVRSGAALVAAVTQQIAALHVGPERPGRSRLEERRFGQVDQRSRFSLARRKAGRT